MPGKRPAAAKTGVGSDVTRAPATLQRRSRLLFTIGSNRRRPASGKRKPCLSHWTLDRTSTRSGTSRSRKHGGAGRDRTDDLKLAKLPLSQLSYSPLSRRLRSNGNRDARGMVGLGRVELPTSRLSGVRSNHLSYRPARPTRRPAGRSAQMSIRAERETRTASSAVGRPKTPTCSEGFRMPSRLRSRMSRLRTIGNVLRKEVIQPQVPLRLPCYDFTPVAEPTVVGCLPCGLAHHLRVNPTPMV